MKNIIYTFIGFALVFTVVGGSVFAARTSVSPFKRDGDAIVTNPTTLTIGAENNPITAGYFTILNASTSEITTLTISGASTGDLDMGGFEITNIGTTTTGVLDVTSEATSTFASGITLNGGCIENASGSCTNLTGLLSNLIVTTISDTDATSTTGYLMQGMAVAFTPQNTGTIHAEITGVMRSTAAGDNTGIQMRYGTGSAPAAGTAVAGDSIGEQPDDLELVTANDDYTFFLLGKTTGLTPGTPYWFDLKLKRSSGSGEINLERLHVRILEEL